MPAAEVRAASSVPVISRKIRGVRPAAERTKRNPFGRFGDDSSEYQSFSLRTAVAGQKASTINQKPIFFFESFSGRAGRDRAGRGERRARASGRRPTGRAVGRPTCGQRTARNSEEQHGTARNSTGRRGTARGGEERSPRRFLRKRRGFCFLHEIHYLCS